MCGCLRVQKHANEADLHPYLWAAGVYVNMHTYRTWIGAWMRMPAQNTNGVRPHVETRGDTNPGDASRHADSIFKTLWETPGSWIPSSVAVQMERGRDRARERPRETRHSK